MINNVDDGVDMITDEHSEVNEVSGISINIDKSKAKALTNSESQLERLKVKKKKKPEHLICQISYLFSANSCYFTNCTIKFLMFQYFQLIFFPFSFSFFILIESFKSVAARKLFPKVFS